MGLLLLFYGLNYGMDCPGFESRYRKKMLIFSEMARPFLWLPEFFRGGKVADV